jgi:erythromycin esterase-like protein
MRTHTILTRERGPGQPLRLRRSPGGLPVTSPRAGKSVPGAGKPAVGSGRTEALGLLLAAAMATASCATPPAPGTVELPGGLQEALLPLESATDLDPLVERALGRELVLIGEATHGTREFYAWRSTLTRRLIEEGGVSFVALEADWVPVSALDSYVRARPGAAGSAREALEAFQSWPRWTWVNPEVEGFVEWLREVNDSRPPEQRVALHGLDLNDPWGAADALMTALQEDGSPYIERGRAAARCLASLPPDPNGFVHSVIEGAPSCLDQARALVAALEADRADDDSAVAGEGPDVLQKARVVANAKEHFLALARPGPDGWNLRVDHLFGTLDRIRGAAEGQGVVWAHNTHVGDARASEMAAFGEVSLGQRAREALGRSEVVLVGFSTFEGEVRAAREWGGRGEVMRLAPAPAGTLDELLARGGRDALLLLEGDDVQPQWATTMGHRGAGVLYDPRAGDEAFLPSVTAERFDALLFLRRTQALDTLPGG